MLNRAVLEVIRMCDSHSYCNDCPLKDRPGCQLLSAKTSKGDLANLALELINELQWLTNRAEVGLATRGYKLLRRLGCEDENRSGDDN